jgi:hypothetical protein
MDVKSEQDALVLLRVTTTKCLAQDLANGTQAGEIDVDLTFTDDPPGGFGRTPERYLHICVVIAADVRTATGRDFFFSVKFVNDHQDKAISKFIFDAAKLLIDSKSASHAETIAWARSIVKSGGRHIV